MPKEHKLSNKILLEADRLISSDRLDQYGDPNISFGFISSLWSAYFGEEITKQDVAMMMILLKIARQTVGEKKSDNLVDICGYAALLAELS